MCTTWLTCLLPERGDKRVWLLILPASDVLLIHLDLLVACLIITCRAHEQVSKGQPAFEERLLVFQGVGVCWLLGPPLEASTKATMMAWGPTQASEQEGPL